MTGSIALDVVLGLVFIYLLYSLLATTLQEIVARWLGLRSHMLLRAVSRMLDDSNGMPTRLSFFNYIFQSLENFSFFFINNFKGRPFTKAFYEHPSIKYLGESDSNRKPSYLNPYTFSITLIDILRGPDYDGTQSQKDLIHNSIQNNTYNISPETLYQIKMLFAESKGDVEKFRILLENWYNEVMNRCSGWYKKQNQQILFVIGFFIAFSFNVDTIAIYRILSDNKSAREDLVKLAIASGTKYEEQIKQIKNQTKNDTIKLKTLTGADTTIVTTSYYLSDTSLSQTRKFVMEDVAKTSNILGLGWPDKDSCKVIEDLKNKNQSCKCSEAAKLSKESEAKIESYNKKYYCQANPYQSDKSMIRILGWVLTALAISLGAPFWFDLLNKVTYIRSSIRPQLSSPAPNPNITANGIAAKGLSPDNRVA